MRRGTGASAWCGLNLGFHHRCHRMGGGARAGCQGGFVRESARAGTSRGLPPASGRMLPRSRRGPGSWRQPRRGLSPPAWRRTHVSAGRSRRPGRLPWSRNENSKPRGPHRGGRSHRPAGDASPRLAAALARAGSSRPRTPAGCAGSPRASGSGLPAGSSPTTTWWNAQGGRAGRRARRGPGRAAGDRRGHARRERPRVPPGGRGGRRSPGHRPAGAVRGDRGARGLRAAQRPVLLRGVPAAARGRRARRFAELAARAADDGVLRIARRVGRDPGRARRGVRPGAARPWSAGS